MGRTNIGTTMWGTAAPIKPNFAALQGVLHSFRIAIVVFVLLRIWVSLLGMIAVLAKPLDTQIQVPYSQAILLELKSTNFQNFFLNPWYRFDTVHYIEIALDGYTDGGHNSAFPPLFPFFVRLVNGLVPSAMASALIVSNLAALVCFWLFLEILNRQVGERNARSAIIWLAVFPASFMLFMAYTESLFLVFLLAFFLFVRKKQWGWAALFAGLATLTRFQGILLSVVFIWEGFSRLRQAEKPRTSKVWAIPFIFGLIPPIFFMVHLLILRFYFQAPMPWEAVSFVWGEKFGWPWAGFLGTIQEMRSDPVIELQVGRFFNLLGAVFVPITLIAARKKIPASWQAVFWLFYLSSVSKLSSNGAFYSAFRYFVPIIPMYLYLAEVLDKPWRRTLGLAICLPAQAGLMMMFYMWIFVF